MQENRKKQSFSLPPDVVEALEIGAEQDGRNKSRYLEAILRKFLKVKVKEPKEPKEPSKVKEESF